MPGKTLLCIDCSGEKEVALIRFSCGPYLEVNCCPRCGGIWLDNGELEDLLKLGRFYLEKLDVKITPKKTNYAPAVVLVVG